MFDIHLLRCVHEALVLVSPLLDVEGIGAYEEEVLDVFECGLHGLRVIVVHHSEGDPSVFELLAVLFFRGCRGVFVRGTVFNEVGEHASSQTPRCSRNEIFQCHCRGHCVLDNQNKLRVSVIGIGPIPSILFQMILPKLTAPVSQTPLK